MNRNRFQIVLDTNGVLMEHGKGDSIKQIADYWGDTSIEAIHDRVLEWKSTRKIERK